MTLLCPRCRVALHERPAHELLIHGCTRCGGVWLDRTAVARLNVALSAQTMNVIDALASAAIKDENAARSIDCPCCAEILIRTPITKAGVVIDRCPDHGAWYDRHELQQVARALGTAPPPGAAPASKPPKERNKKSPPPPKKPEPPKSTAPKSTTQAPAQSATAKPTTQAPPPPAAAPQQQPPASSGNTSNSATLLGVAEVIVDIALSFFR